MRRGTRTVFFADKELAEQVMTAIEQALPEGQHPFKIEVAEASGQLDVRVPSLTTPWLLSSSSPWLPGESKPKRTERAVRLLWLLTP